MRKLLFAFLLLPFFAQSQTLEFGINAGVAQASKETEKMTGQTTPASNWSGSGSTQNITAAINIFSIKAGAGYELSNRYKDMRSVFAFIDYSKAFKNHEIYAGLIGGSVSFTNEKTIIYPKGASGYRAGVNAGYTYTLPMGIGFNGQIEYSYFNVSAKSNTGTKTNTTNFLSITAGIHYKLKLHK